MYMDYDHCTFTGWKECVIHNETCITCHYWLLYVYEVYRFFLFLRFKKRQYFRCVTTIKTLRVLIKICLLKILEFNFINTFSVSLVWHDIGNENNISESCQLHQTHNIVPDDYIVRAPNSQYCTWWLYSTCYCCKTSLKITNGFINKNKNQII
jgi:hypothetical protein